MDPRPYCPRPRWKFSFHTYQPQPGFPKEATSTRPDLLCTLKGTGSGPVFARAKRAPVLVIIMFNPL